MRKAIMIEARVWIEGEDEAAHDFAASSTQALREIIEAGAAKHPELRLTVKRIREAKD
jgi:hypothetical protein